MTVEFEVVTDIGAPRERCFDLSCNVDAHIASMLASNERAVAGVTSGQIGIGESVTWKLMLGRYMRRLIERRNDCLRRAAEADH